MHWQLCKRHFQELVSDYSDIQSIIPKVLGPPPLYSSLFYEESWGEKKARS